MANDAYQNFAPFYDHTAAYLERKDIAFYVARARAAAGPVLELGCGSGRILISLARAGVAITGLDASEAMLNVCRDRLRQEGLRAELHHGDMCHFDLGRRFALVTIPFRPFQHLLDVQEQMDCLAAIRRHLAPGGHLIFDVFDPNLKILAQDTPDWVTEFEFDLPDGRRVRRSFRRLSLDTARQNVKLEIRHEVLGGQTYVSPLDFRYFFRWELEHLLVRCGYRVLEVLGDFTGGPPGGGELVFVASV